MRIIGATIAFESDLSVHTHSSFKYMLPMAGASWTMQAAPFRSMSQRSHNLLSYFARRSFVSADQGLSNFSWLTGDPTLHPWPGGTKKSIAFEGRLSRSDGDNEFTKRSRGAGFLFPADLL